ncbi:MAG: hypothetical protein CL903_02175 [Dehalococcoidia bacterium]|nr:hypothetical protein [Dehalococcoidia bacterium]MQG09806.1 hypothetical protein [SAR202 cluster bacterium]
MEIRWQGKSFFEVSSAYGNILINPSDNNSEEIQLFSGFNLNPHKDKKVNIIDSPGEYEIKGIAIRGIPSPLTEPSLSRDINVIYVVDIENLRLGVLGYPGHELSAQVMQQIGKIDILILDGSSSSLEINELASMIRSLESKIVLISNNNVSKLLVELGIKEPTIEKKISITKSSISEEQKIILLEN